MIITKEQQEALVAKYNEDIKIKEWITFSQISGFVDGINATIKLMQQIEKRRSEEVEK